MNMMASVGEAGALPVFRTSIDGLSQADLRSVIPQIIRNTTGVRPQYGNQLMKPKWWPYDLPFCNPHDDFRDPSRRKKPWNEVLREIIRNCYQYYGQEHLLNGNDMDKENPIKVVNNQDGSVSFITHSAVVTLEDRQNTPYASCPPTLEAATPGRSLSASTGALVPLPTGLFKSSTPSKSSPANQATPVQTKTAESKPFVEVFMCFFCEKEFHHKHALQHHQKECVKWPAHFSRNMSSIRTRSRPEQLHIVPCKPRKLIEEKVTYPPKSTYIESLDLLPQAKAESVRRQSHSRIVDCDVIVLDSKPPKTPTTPRTPKSLMSQLSRDISPPARVRLKVDEEDAVDSVEESSDDESESGKSEGEGRYRPRRVASLLHIDISSLLGERVRKHISAYFANLETYQTSPDSSGKNYENFCRTPTKSKVTERLRSRGKDNFQVTFRKSKRTAPVHCHQYKFRNSDRGEFCRIIETGLNRRSRALKRQVKKCSVVLTRVSDKVIKKWTRRRKGAVAAKGPFTQFNLGSTGFQKARSSMMSQQLPMILGLPEAIRDQCLLQLGHGASLESVYQRLLAGINQPVLSSSPADLTPPSTPEDISNMGDDDVICLDDSGPWNTTPPTSGFVRKMGPKSSQLKNRLTAPKSQKRESPTNQSLRNAMLNISSEDPHLDDDVISISSTDSAELTIVSPESLKRGSNWSPTESDLPAKRRRVEQLKPSALLFRCHLCYEEITCHDNANLYIKGHFAKTHNVHNIDLIEHLDPSGQKVVSIVEIPTPEQQPPQSSFYLSTANSPALAPVNLGRSQNTGGAAVNNSAKPTAKHKPAILQAKKPSMKLKSPQPTNSPSASSVLKSKSTVAMNKSKLVKTDTVSKPNSVKITNKQEKVTNKVTKVLPGNSQVKKRPEIKVMLKLKTHNNTAVKTSSRAASSKVTRSNARSGKSK